LSFEVNRGQTDARVKFLARGQGYTLFLTPQEVVLALRKASLPQGRGAADGQSFIDTPQSVAHSLLSRRSAPEVETGAPVTSPRMRLTMELERIRKRVWWG
jgi:hypothetical protein